MLQKLPWPPCVGISQRTRACANTSQRNRAVVHFVRSAARSYSSAAVTTADESLGGKPSNILRRRRCARHCRCWIALEREPKTLPHAGHRSSFTKSLARALRPWARALWACLAFSLIMKTRTFSLGQSGQSSTSAGNSAGRAQDRSTVQMQCVSNQLRSQRKLSFIALSPTGVTRALTFPVDARFTKIKKNGHTVRRDS